MGDLSLLRRGEEEICHCWEGGKDLPLLGGGRMGALSLLVGQSLAIARRGGDGALNPCWEGGAWGKIATAGKGRAELLYRFVGGGLCF